MTIDMTTEDVGAWGGGRSPTRMCSLHLAEAQWHLRRAIDGIDDAAAGLESDALQRARLSQLQRHIEQLIDMSTSEIVRCSA